MDFARVDVIRLEIHTSMWPRHDAFIRKLANKNDKRQISIPISHAKACKQAANGFHFASFPFSFSSSLFFPPSESRARTLCSFARARRKPFSTSRSVASILETFADLRLLANLSGKTFYLPLEALLTFRSHPPENIPMAHFVVDKITFNSVLRDSYVEKKITLSEGQNSSAESLSPRFLETSSSSHLHLLIKHATCNSYNNFWFYLIISIVLSFVRVTLFSVSHVPLPSNYFITNLLFC